MPLPDRLVQLRTWLFGVPSGQSAGECIHVLLLRREPGLDDRMKLMIGTTLVLAALGAAAPAHADTNQDAYVSQLQAFGIGLENTSDRLVKNGYLMCEAMNTGTDSLAVATQAAPRAGLSVAQTGYQVGAAIRWLCPEQDWQIKELIGGADPTVPGVTTEIAGFLGK